MSAAAEMLASYAALHAFGYFNKTIDQEGSRGSGSGGSWDRRPGKLTTLVGEDDQKLPSFWFCCSSKPRRGTTACGSTSDGDPEAPILRPINSPMVISAPSITIGGFRSCPGT